MSSPKRILLVGGNSDTLTPLAEAGFETEVVPNSEQALHYLESNSFDLLVLSDPDGIDGLKSLPPRLRVGVVTSLRTSDAVRQAILDRGFTPIQAAFPHLLAFAMGSESGDDIEVLSARPNWISLRLRCKIDIPDRITFFLRWMGTGLPDDEQQGVAIAFREMLLNAIEHGCGSDPAKRVVVSFVRAAGALLCYIRDPGKGFSLDELAHAAVAHPVDSPTGHIEIREQLGLRPGGFGILMTSRLVDDLIYNEAGNEVLLIKYLK